MNTNNTLPLIALTVAVFATGLGLSSLINKNVHLNLNDDTQSISVSGEAERLVSPDTARVSFSMTRKDKELSRASDSVNKRVGEMLAALVEYGIEEKDIKTTSYNVYPEYDYVRESGRSIFSGYRVDQSLELVMRDLDKVSQVLSKISNLEVDNVSGLSFYVDEDAKIHAELRAEAIAEAKMQAKKLAKELGVSLSTILGFHENRHNNKPQPLYARSFAAESTALDISEASIPSGENTYRATVSIEFKID